MFHLLAVHLNEKQNTDTHGHAHRLHGSHQLKPTRTAVPFWGQTTQNLTGLSPKTGPQFQKGQHHSVPTHREHLYTNIQAKGYLHIETDWYLLPLLVQHYYSNRF